MSREVERYGIYLADRDPTRGREITKTRPVVIVSQDAMNRHLDTVVVCPLTTKLHPQWRSRVQILCARRKAEIPEARGALGRWHNGWSPEWWNDWPPPRQEGKKSRPTLMQRSVSSLIFRAVAAA